MKAQREVEQQWKGLLGYDWDVGSRRVVWPVVDVV